MELYKTSFNFMIFFQKNVNTDFPFVKNAIEGKRRLIKVLEGRKITQNGFMLTANKKQK